jgi:lipopolysaccharide export system protein LptA
MISLTMALTMALVIVSLQASPAFAQDAEEEGPREVQVAFDSLRVRTIEGRTVSEWLRPVLRQEDFQLRAANGYDEGNGFIRFWGDVVIIEKGDTIRAVQVRYQREDRIGEARGNVRMTDGEVTLLAPFARYFSEQELTVFEEGVTYEDSAAVLIADWARYLSEDNRAEFAGNVILSQEGMDLQADSVLHLRETEESWAWGSIAADRISEDDSTRTLILADSLYRAAQVDSIRVTGNARLLQMEPAASDTLILEASVITVRPGESLSAQDSVVVASAGYSVRADSLASIEGPEGRTESELRGSPIAWVEDTQLVADRMDLSDNGRADTIRASGNVFVATPDSLSGRVNQLSGRHLVVVLDADSLRLLDIREQARAVLFMESEEDGSTVGFNGSGDGLQFQFADGELDRVSFYTGVEGTYYAGALLDQLSNLSGFIFTPDDRPKRQRLIAAFWMTWFERTMRSERQQIKTSCGDSC